MYDVYDKFAALIEFLEIPEEEVEEIEVWSDDSLTYEGKEYELYKEEHHYWTKLLGVYDGWYIYETDNRI